MKVRQLLFVLVMMLASPLLPAAQAQFQAPGASVPPAVAELLNESPALDGSGIAEPGAAGASDEAAEDGRLTTAVEIAVLLTVLSVLPAVLITVTSFTRIIILLSFVRRALSINELPPNPVLIGLALFLTLFVMTPVAQSIHANAWVPYDAGQVSAKEAGALAWHDLSGFLVSNTRASEIQLFADLADAEIDLASSAPQDVPLRVVVPAFVLSELKTAFQMGFLLFLPFLVIDLVVASVLLSMGMFMLPPVMISTPFKILIFVLVDGWHLVCESAVTSFIAT